MATVITTLDQLKTACSSGGDYELGADISGVNVTVPSNKTLNLDLKTYTLSATSGSVITVNGGTLVLSGTTGKITGGTGTNAGSGYLKTYYGGGVYIKSGSFIMNGGNITGNTAQKGTIGLGYGGGVSAYGGSFTLNGGTISNNTGSRGGGVHVREGRTFTMTGGTISNNTGDGIYLGTNSTFTMSGGYVVNNSGSTGGAYLYDTVTAYISGGVFENNRYNSANRLQGLDVSDDSLLYLSGGVEIKDGLYFINDYDTTQRPLRLNGNLTGVVYKIQYSNPSGSGHVETIGEIMGSTLSTSYTGAEKIILIDSSRNPLASAKVSGTNLVWGTYVPPVTGVKIPVNVNGVWKDATPSVNVNGVWKDVIGAWVNVSGAWKEVK